MAAVATSAAVIASSPFAAELRAALRAALGEQFTMAVLFAMGAVVGVGLVGAMMTMKERRLARVLADV